MKLNDFISETLDELKILKNDPNKKRYTVQELEFEFSFVIKKSGAIGTNKLWDLFIPVTVDGQYSSDKIHKVKIKLEPKNSTSATNNRGIQQKTNANK